jgi:flavin reductase (DIM6/NTAB) family NADH-FMN oxidoreductase RutF
MLELVTSNGSLRSYYQPYPGVPTIVGARTPEGEANFMPAIWNVGLSYAPPLFGVAVSRKRFTHGLMTAERAWSATFHPWSQVEEMQELALVSGSTVDKIAEFGLSYTWGVRLPVPVLEGAYAAFELELEEVHEVGDHDLFVGRIEAVWEDAERLDELGRPSPDVTEPVLYYGRFRYGTVGKALRDFPTPERLRGS